MEYHTFFILASGYWLPDYIKDYEIQLRWYCKLACITEKTNTLWCFTLTKWKASL